MHPHRIHQRRQQHGRGSLCHHWLCIPHQRRRRFVVLKTTRNSLIIHHQEQVRRSNARREGGAVATQPPHRRFQPLQEPNNYALRQPISHRTCPRQSVPHPHQAHQCAFPLHSLGGQTRSHPASLLPNQRHGGGCAHKSAAISEGQALCHWSRTAREVRGSVEIPVSSAEHGIDHICTVLQT